MLTRYALFISLGFLSLLAPMSGQARYYVGAEAGYSYVHYTPAQLPDYARPTSIKHDGFAPLARLGYIANEYFATELGWVFSHRPEFYGIARNTRDPAKIKNDLIYWNMVTHIPLTDDWDGILQMGMGYVIRGGITTNQQTVLAPHHLLRPVWGAGLVDNLTQHWQLTATWLMACAKKSQHLPTTHFAGVGLNFLF